MPDGFQRFYTARMFEKEIQAWVQNGKPLPAPHSVKQSVIGYYRDKHKLPFFVETGTLYGNTIWNQLKSFERLYSIELSEELYKKAVKRFEKANKVDILQGDSSVVLKEIVPLLGEPSLFWLDGHYSGTGTAKGEKDCPIIEELNHILDSNLDHVLLIDDARCFTNEGKYKDYPTIAFLKEFILSHKPGSTFEVKDDIIRIELKNTNQD